MPKEYAKRFYNSKAWEQCRINYLKQVNYLCERCLAKGEYKPAEEVHHKCYITPENINDPSVVLNFANLEALCHECHTKEHHQKEKRYNIDELGRVELP